MNMQGGFLKSFELFRTIDMVLLANIMMHLQPLHVEQGAIIYRRGDKADEMFFLVSGRVDYFLEHYRVVYKTMTAGSYFGDFEIIFKCIRKHTVRAKVDSNILTLHKDVNVAKTTQRRHTGR